MTGLEPATTRTPYVYATNCATSRLVFNSGCKSTTFLQNKKINHKKNVPNLLQTPSRIPSQSQPL